MVTNTIRKRRDSLIAFFVLTFGITWGLAALLVLFPGVFEAFFGALSAASPVFILAVAAPTIAASVLTFARGGWKGLRTLYAKFAQWRFGMQWYAVLLAGIPLVNYLVSRMMGAKPTHVLGTLGSVLGFLLLNLVLGPLGEELGWRGFALPRLLERFSPLVASLALGLIWGVWHLPAFFLAGLPQSNLAIPLFLIKTLLLAILATWIFIHTKGSVLSMVLFHWIVNMSLDIFGAPELPLTLAFAGIAGLVIVFDQQVGWLRRDEKRIRQDAGATALGAGR